MNLLKKQKQIHRFLKTYIQLPKEKHGRVGINWEIGVDIYTLITNKNMFYSTGNSTQYPIMTFMGKESKEKSGYMYMYN